MSEIERLKRQLELEQKYTQLLKEKHEQMAAVEKRFTENAAALLEELNDLKDDDNDE